ncbi:hypothetical protein FQA39_LY15944 [Lamprigera yunnana]|nr:hypothetical protein FQA39_LY15944 [Lamprigera yunnana]
MSDLENFIVNFGSNDVLENATLLSTAVIKEEVVQDGLQLFSQAPGDTQYIIEPNEKDVTQPFNKYPIHLGQICKLDNNNQQEQTTTHYVKHKLHDNKPTRVWECGVCSKEFGHQYTLMRHLPTHTDERKFQCNTCGKAFRQMSTLSQHRAIHSTERPYVCELCRKTFNRVSTLISHRKTHTGMKPHRCHLCNKAFHQKGNLRNHVFTHTNERPYKCDLCSKGFNQMSNLMCHKIKAHQRAEKPRYSCQICGKEFQKRMGLRNHEQNHHGVQTLDPTPSTSNNIKYTNGVLVEPINTAAMQHALATNQTPFALLRPLNNIPVLVRVLAAGEKQMLVPATAEDLKKHGFITITPQVDGDKTTEHADPLADPIKIENDTEVTVKPLGSTVQIKIPVVATVVQRCGKDGNMCMAIESPDPNNENADNQNYVLTTTANNNIEGDYMDYTNLNFTSFDETNNICISSELDYVDECGNVISFEEFKAKDVNYEEFSFEPQTGSLPSNLSLENNIINFPESVQDIDEQNILNMTYVEGGDSNCILEVLKP